MSHWTPGTPLASHRGSRRTEFLFAGALLAAMLLMGYYALTAGIARGEQEEAAYREALRRAQAGAAAALPRPAQPDAQGAAQGTFPDVRVLSARTAAENLERAYRASRDGPQYVGDLRTFHEETPEEASLREEAAAYRARATAAARAAAAGGPQPAQIHDEYWQVAPAPSGASRFRFLGARTIPP
jgi:hypothetical protein